MTRGLFAAMQQPPTPLLGPRRSDRVRCGMSTAMWDAADVSRLRRLWSAGRSASIRRV